MECDLDSFRSTFGTVHFISYMQTANSLFPSSGSTVWHPGCKNTTRTEERHRERVGIWASLTPLSMTLSWLKASLCSCLMTMFNWKRWRFRMCNERFCAGYYCSRAELLNLNLLWFKSFAYWGSIACMCVPLHVCVCKNTCSCAYLHVDMFTLMNVWTVSQAGEAQPLCDVLWTPLSLPSQLLPPSLLFLQKTERQVLYSLLAMRWHHPVFHHTLYIGHNTLYAALCWRQPAVLSLCVPWSHSVMSSNTLGYAYIKGAWDKDAHTCGGAHTRYHRWLICLF